MITRFWRKGDQLVEVRYIAGGRMGTRFVVIDHGEHFQTRIQIEEAAFADPPKVWHVIERAGGHQPADEQTRLFLLARQFRPIGTELAPAMTSRKVKAGRVAVCRGGRCTREILWCRTEDGKTLPLDLAAPVYEVVSDPDPEGAPIVRRRRDAYALHFPLCPDADRFSRRG